MNSANLNRSERLQRTLAVLQDGKPHTTLDLIREAGICAVNSVVAEIRANGYKIECKRTGNKWFYSLEG